MQRPTTCIGLHITRDKEIWREREMNKKKKNGITSEMLRSKCVIFFCELICVACVWIGSARGSPGCAVYITTHCLG